jgi:hypothetical protein
MRTPTLALVSCIALAEALTGCLAPRLANPLDPPAYQSQVLVGPVVGGNRNYHTGGFRTIDEPGCPTFDQGSGWGYLAGISAEYLPNLRSTWSVIPRVTYEERPGTFVQHLPDVKVAPVGTGEPIDQSVDVASAVMYRMVAAELMYKREFAQLLNVRFAVEAGPVGAVVLSGRNIQTENLVDPENARFINPRGLPTEADGRKLVLYNGDIPGRSGFRLSLKAGIQAEIPLFRNGWYMTPGIYYDYGVTDVTSSENWKLNSMLFSVDLRRAF